VVSPSPAVPWCWTQEGAPWWTSTPPCRRSRTPAAHPVSFACSSRFGGGREVVDELTEVEAIERIEPVLSPVQLLLDGDALAVQGSWSFCFQAFVDDAVVLGVPVSSAVTDAPDVLEVSPSGQCITLEDLRTEPAPARTAHVTVRMAEATRTFDVRLPALAE
jgi:hypothetical protein